MHLDETNRCGFVIHRVGTLEELDALILDLTGEAVLFRDTPDCEYPY